jgi:hypothetical protein
MNFERPCGFECAQGAERGDIAKVDAAVSRNLAKHDAPRACFAAALEI